MRADTRSLTGNAAAQGIAVAIDQQDSEDHGAYARRWRLRRGLGPKAARLPAPRPGDGPEPGTCPACGFPGPHRGPGECITALRDRIAVLEFTGGARTGRKPKGRPTL